MTLTKTKALGNFAEDRAAEYLVSLGWRVIERNVRNDYGELDVIAVDTKTRPEELVIVEVRARTVGMTQAPLDSIGSRKLRTLLRSSQEYIDSLNWAGFWRIDVVGITFHDKDDFTNWELEHVRDITAGYSLWT